MLKCALFTILKHYTSGEKLPTGLVTKFSDDDWLELYKTSVQQGVVAIAYSTISPFANNGLLPRKLKIQWALHAENIEQRTQYQLITANELTDIYKTNNINTVVLKGLGLGIYYPNSKHRECGDFDCYLFDDYQNGIEIAKKHGAKVAHADYKHTQLVYERLSVEVHKYFTSFRGKRKKHLFEQTLNNLIRNHPFKPIREGSNILQPNPTFNAIFIIYHTLFHFLFESVKLRHILDWGLMVKVEQDKIDWDQFNSICKENKMLKFAEAITAICNDYLGFDLDIPIKAVSEYRDNILMDIMSGTDGVSNKLGWDRRLQLLKNTYKTKWKYQLIDSTFISDLTNRIFYYIFSNDNLKTKIEL